MDGNLKNMFGEDLDAFNERTSAERVGRRIREVRIARGMSQAQLGELVGLNGDRIQKYENGVRKPKNTLLYQIAKALDVEMLALMDPVLDSDISTMYTLFEMEKYFNLKIKRLNDQIVLFFGESVLGSMTDLLEDWYDEKSYIDQLLMKYTSNAERDWILNEYNIWKWTFPNSPGRITEKAFREMRKEKIQKQIELLQQELAELDDQKDSKRA